MGLIVFANYFMGIVNYPLALFAAMQTVWFVLIVPLRDPNTSWLRGFISSIFLLVTLPSVQLLLWQMLDINAMSMILSFTRQNNSFVLAYFCGVYFPLHVLSLRIACTSPKQVSKVT